jgi:Spy/CpxP family protein refolding chaperone
MFPPHFREEHIMRSTVYVTILYTAIVMNLIAGVSFSQEPKYRHDHPSPEIREKVGMIKKWKMIEALEIGEEQTVRLFPRVNKLEELKVKHLEERRELLHRLKMVLDSSASEDRARKIKELVEAHTKMEERYHSDLTDAREDVFAVLTVEQKAKYLLFEELFQKQLIDILSERREPKKRVPRR